jgi:hypothetical protein
VTFLTSVQLDGISADDLDEAAQSSFLDVTAAAMTGVEASDLFISSYSTVTVARKLTTSKKPENLRSLLTFNKRQLSATAVNIEFSTSARLQNSGYDTSADLAQALTNEVAASYADPATATSFVTECELLNSATIATSTVVIFGAPVLDPLSITEVEVATAAPTSAPPNKRNGGGGSSSSSDNTVVISVVVSVVVLVVCTGMIGVGYYVHAQKSKSQEGGGDSDAAPTTTEGAVDRKSGNHGASPMHRMSDIQMVDNQQQEKEEEEEEEEEEGKKDADSEQDTY